MKKPIFSNNTGLVYLLTFLALLPITVKADARINANKIKAAIVKLDKLTETKLQETGIPAIAIGIVYRDKVVYLKGFGVREAGKPELVNEDTVFQLASVSKPLGSTVISWLVSDKLVAWDDLVTRYDSTFALNDAYITSHLTIRDLYSHRSGLPDHAGDLLEDMGYDRAYVLEHLRYIPLENRFRAEYAYTNFGVTEGAVAVANAVGKPWEAVSKEFYNQLGMTQTSSVVLTN